MFLDGSQLIGFGVGGGASIVTSGLQLHLRADAYVSGQTWTDSTVNAYGYFLGATNGSEASDPTINTGPPAYWSFDGGDYFKQSAAYSGSIMRKIGRNDQAFTVEAWIYRGSTITTDEGLFSSIDSGGDNGIQILIDGSGNKPRVTPRPLGSNGDGTNAVDVGAWKHFVVNGKPDGSTTGTFYTNAVANGTWSLNNSSFTSGDCTRTPSLCTEAAGGGSGRFQSGSRLAVVRMYDRILTAEEVAQNFTVERGTFGV